MYRGGMVVVNQQSLINKLEESGIKAACFGTDEDERELALTELLLDERHVENGIVLEKELFCEVGGKNLCLPAKWEYELALRVAEKETVRVIPFSMVEETVTAQNVKNNNAWNAFCVDAYIAGRYSEFLKKQGLFEAVLEAVLEEGQEAEDIGKVEQFMADMIGHKECYYLYYEATQPILIFRGSTCCYNVLNVFADKIAEALKNRGNCIEFYDAETEDVQGLAGLLGKHYKALIGFQAWILSAKRKDEKNSLLDRIGGPKLNFIFDHPIWMQEQLKHVPARYYALTHDRNYVKFIEEYNADVSRVFLLPPGGRVWDNEGKYHNNRIYDITFLGTYGDYRKNLAVIEKSAAEVKTIATNFFSEMKKNPNVTAEQSLYKVLEGCGRKTQKEEFLSLFGEMKPVVQCVMYYYREKVVEEILKAKIELHVYGDSWKESPFAKKSNLKIHDAVYGDAALQVLEQSKISLNVMAWHKDGFTERIADSMLAGAVVVSDYSRQLEEFYEEETVLFDLEQLGELPKLLQQLLEDEKSLQRIAASAQEKARKTATWDARAKELLEIIEKESRNR